MNKRLLSLCMAVVMLLSIVAIAPVQVRAASQMTTSENCLSIIKELEGFSGKPYKDTDGKYTIGYGTRCPDELVSKYMDEPMTKEEADAELRKEVVTYEKAVNAFIDRHALSFTQGQFDGVVSLVFNCGTSWLTKGNTLIEALAGGATGNEAIYAFAIYSMSAGKRSLGHISRRLAEANMYLNEQYSRTPPEHYSYVLYNGNGGTVDSYDVQGYDCKLTAEPAVSATYEGYTFRGWFTQPSGGEKVTKLDAATKGMTLYAQWSDGSESTPSTPETPSEPDTPKETPISPMKIKVTGSSVNLRKGPGLIYDVVKSVSKGTELTITATFNEGKYIWGKCTTGWVRLDNTDYEDRITPPVEVPEQKPEQEPENNTITKVYGTVIGTDTLNVRKSPDGAIVGKLNRGDKVEILEQKTVAGRAWGRCSKGWICVRTYVKLETVTMEETNAPSKPTTPTTPSAPSQPETQTKLYGTVINTASQNVRNAPDGKVVGKLMKGERFEILERKSVNGREWGRCSKGWVCLRTYVKLEEVKVTNTGSSSNQGGNTTTTTTKTYATVIGTDSLNVRTTPDGAVCGSLKKGEKVEILEQKTVNGRLWGRCSKGWICLRTYAKLETVTVNSTSNKQIGKVTASALNIRSGAGTGYSVVGKLYKGETVEILEKKTVDGTTWGKCSKGWISLDYVQF